MTELDLTRAGLLELGEDATNEQLAAHAHDRLGAHLDPRFIPLYRATIHGEAHHRHAREQATRMIEEDRKKE